MEVKSNIEILNKNIEEVSSTTEELAAGTEETATRLQEITSMSNNMEDVARGMNNRTRHNPLSKKSVLYFLCILPGIYFHNSGLHILLLLQTVL